MVHVWGTNVADEGAVAAFEAVRAIPHESILARAEERPGSGFRVSGLGVELQASGCILAGPSSQVQRKDLIWDFGSRVWRLGFRVQCVPFPTNQTLAGAQERPGAEFRGLGSGFRIQGCRCQGYEFGV